MSRPPDPQAGAADRPGKDQEDQRSGVSSLKCSFHCVEEEAAHLGWVAFWFCQSDPVCELKLVLCSPTFPSVGGEMAIGTRLVVKRVR